MKTNIRIVNIESKISYNKVLLKADAVVKIMYLTEDNRINIKECKIPVMGFVDIINITENDLCDISYEVRSLIVKPNNVQEHSIYIESEIELSCKVYQNKEINLIEDLYSPSINLKLNTHKINTVQSKKIIKDECNIRERQNVQDIKNEKLLDVDIIPLIRKSTVLNNKIVLEGELNVKFIYTKGVQNTIQYRVIALPFNHSIESEEIDQNISIEVNIDVKEQDIIIMPDESLEIKVDLNLVVSIFKNTQINMINEIQIDEKCKNEVYSIVIYYVKPKDTLWSIAKKFKSTVKAISEINEIEDENKIYVGEQLYIPKFTLNKTDI